MSKKTQETKEAIWNNLISRGYKLSSHSNKILRFPDPKYPGEEIKYRFGKNNLLKFRMGSKVASVPFSRLEIKDGKIVKKAEKVKVLGTEIEVK